MIRINLRDYYPFYNVDMFVDIPDEGAAALMDAERQERNHIRRVLWNKAYYSLDADDGIESNALFAPPSPHEVYERKVTGEQLCNGILALPGKQGRRVYAYYILGISVAGIARAEGVSTAAVSTSIERGIRNMETYLKKFHFAH